MGVMRFLIPGGNHLSDEAIACAYLAGIEGIPWRGRSLRTDTGLDVVREESESSYFHIPWKVDGYGEIVLSTTSLMERERPYYLPIELARGTINRIRNQQAGWQMAGLEVPSQITVNLKRAAALLSRAVLNQHDTDAACNLAEESIRCSLEVIGDLMREYTRQAMEVRHQQVMKLPTVFGAHLGRSMVGENRANMLSAAFNSTVVGMSWSDIEGQTGNFQWNVYDQQVEWCRRRAVRIIGGPLFHLDMRDMPDWLFLWEDDFDNLESQVLSFIDAAVNRYRGKITLWNCAARINSNGTIPLTEEQRLHLTVRAIETVRRIEPQVPVIVSLDQPWAEYVASQPVDMSPLQYADTLSRADLGLSGFGLEINLGYWPGGTIWRDPMEISRLLDRWSLLGLPLVVFLTAPSSDAADPRASQGIRPLSEITPDGLSPQSQRDVLEQIVRLLLIKHCVQGIVWNQLYDHEPHIFPHSGLFDAEGDPKPVLDSLTTIRQEHLV